MNAMENFFRLAVTDTKVKNRIKELLGDVKLLSAGDEDLAEIGAYAAELGYQISLEEAKEYLVRLSKVAEFYDKVTKDAEKAKQLENILNGKNILDASDAELEKIGAMAWDMGYRITMDDAKNYIAAEKA